MRVAITGARGLIGSALTRALRERGDDVVVVTRHPGAREIGWDPERGFEEPGALGGHDAIVHLAGESIVGRWTSDKKQEIRDSRVLGTRTVVQALTQASPRPNVLVCASAIGIYGDRRQEILDEGSSITQGGWLAEVTKEWESAALEAEVLGVRVVLARFGVVLSREGGALPVMLAPFRLGLGGRVGSGEQWMSWIHIDDVARALVWTIDHEGASGPFNIVAPTPVSNREFTRRLGKLLHRPTILPVPKLAVKLALGEMGETALLHSQRVMPKRLLEGGFGFRFPTLDDALRDLVAKR